MRLCCMLLDYYSHLNGQHVHFASAGLQDRVSPDVLVLPQAGWLHYDGVCPL